MMLVKVVHELIKLTCFSLLYHLKDDRKLSDGSFFRDMRLNVLSRLIETVKDNMNKLNLKRYLSDDYESFYLEVDRLDKSKTDVYVSVSFVHDFNRKLYYVNPNSESSLTIIYDLPLEAVFRCIYVIDYSKLFPFRSGVAYCGISGELEDKITKIRQEEIKNETNTKVSFLRKII